jgi:hypothetical protein
VLVRKVVQALYGWRRPQAAVAHRAPATRGFGSAGWVWGMPSKPPTTHEPRGGNR